MPFCVPFKVECQLNLRRWYCVQNDNVERLFQLTVDLEVVAVMVSESRVTASALCRQVSVKCVVDIT